MKVPTMKQLFLCTLLLCGSTLASAAEQTFSWKENGKTRSAIVDDNSRASLDSKARISGLSLAGEHKGIRFYRTDSGRSRELAAGQQALIPVLRQGQGSYAPWLLPAGGVIVQTSDETALRQFAAEHGVSVTASPVSGYWLLPTAPGQAALDLASQLQNLPGVQTAAPNWATSRGKR